MSLIIISPDLIVTEKEGITIQLQLFHTLFSVAPPSPALWGPKIGGFILGGVLWDSSTVWSTSPGGV